ncbi:phytanoyl-CoA dioxygenase family protein [Microcoleus sp. FACHB-1515]|uniref:phytanoyl-CoA dioxygenase family protein n=1 Tax=Cyanophyceae TaxID=3028117 RepID=UPI00168A3CB9|nr:phytanoyl-CoA dioxygenase family protein [Microcoleus sp. FACHB-1515]MBD2092583.1 phytanoyl-CoA dioxygenase family protein [Microcoleus sp. FACHB-1515]
MLSNAQIDQFHTDGFLIVENLLDSALVDRLAERVEPLFQGEFETGVYPDEWYWNPRLGLPGASGQMSNVWKSDRTLASVILSEKIGKICAQLGNWSGTRLLSDSLWRKPFGASETTHHQDSMYSFYHTPQEIVVCWIALSHAVPQGSSIEYVRGSHRWPLSQTVAEFHAGSRSYRADMEQAAKQAGIDRPDVVQLALQPGSCAFHHGHMWHGSGKNLLPNSIRRSLVIAHIPANSQFKPTAAYVEGGYLAGRYKRFGDNTMDESFFPIVYQQDGDRSPFLDTYCGDALRPLIAQ